MIEQVFADTGILHADLDAFYASVEQRDDPGLRGRPMAVGEGVVLAASYEARRHGVRSGMAGSTARGLCPNLVAVPPRMEAYVEASRQVFDLFEATTPMVEPLSIDEAFLDVRGLWRLEASPAAIGARLRRQVLDEVGLALSVGAARTKFLAKVCSAVAKPDGLLIVEPSDEIEFLHALPVSRVWGVGPVTCGQLAKLGVTTVGDLARLRVDTLEHGFGRAAGRHLHELAWNRDTRAVTAPRRARSIGAQHAMPRRSRGLDEVSEVLLGLSDRVGSRARSAGRGGRTITIRFRFADQARATRSRSVREPLTTTASIHRHAVDIAAELLGAPEAEGTVLSERGLTLVGIALGRLVSTAATQLALPFADGERIVDAAVDEVRDRFGRGAVARAATLGQRFVPTPLHAS